MDILTARKIYCVGIGGIGISALAQFWRAQGKAVSGSDADTGGHRAENVGEVELIVYSDAVPEDNVERREARRRGIPEISYAHALGEVSRQYRTIVVTGTHGKSTTTAMLGLILEAAGLDPLVIVGSKVPGWKYGNLRIPRMPAAANSANNLRDSRDGVHSRYPIFIVEGDDYRDHFLELAPHAVVVTSIEWDHPDYFRDLAHTVESFQKLVEKVSEEGLVVVNGDDAGCKRFIQRLGCSPIRANRRTATYGRGSEIFRKLNLRVPGEFNRYNATAAATCALALGVSMEMVQKTLGEFKGIWRRFEIVGERISRMPTAANNANEVDFYIVEKELSYQLNGLLFGVQNQLGTKFQEKHYGRALEVLLQKEGISYKKEVAFDLAFEGNKIGTFRADFVIADKILLELKTADQITREHEMQLLRYVESLGLPLGMIVNFRQRPLGVVRVVNEKNYSRNSRGKRPFAPSPITIISDYAHHPTAIRATMKAAREAYPERRLILVYQPHQHSRTRHLFNDFVETLAGAADVVIVSEIYAVKGRMEDHDINSQQLVQSIARLRNRAIGTILYGGDLAQTKKAVFEYMQPGDVIIFMGAGDIDALAREITK